MLDCVYRALKEGGQGLRDWIDMFVKTPFQAVADEHEAEVIKNAAVENLKPILYKGGKWYADYVRIRMKSCKCGRNQLSSVS